MAGNEDKSVRVVIVGAGTVGSTFAYTLMISGLAQEIVLIDMDRPKAEAQALDLNHGMGFAPPVDIWAGDYADCAGADIVVITAGTARKAGESRLDLMARNCAIVRSVIGEVTAQTTEAIVVMITNPMDLLTYDAIRHSGLPWTQVFGSGTVLDCARFRYLLSAHCRMDPRQVHAYVLGEHGDSQVAAWSMTDLGGVPIDEFCAQCHGGDFEAMKSDIARQVKESGAAVIKSKGFTNYGIGQAVVRIMEAIIRDERSILTVSSLVQGKMGIDDVCLSLPCVVGRQGIVRQLEVKLSDAEARQLRDSAAKLKEAQAALPA